MATTNSDEPTSVDDATPTKEEEHVDDVDTTTISDDLSKLQIQDTSSPKLPIFLCDAGYGLPREPRPRKEKVLAIARQIVNFLEWQVANDGQRARVEIVGCPNEETQQALQQRILQLWSTELPSHVLVSCETLVEACQRHSDSNDPAVYLSPDASERLEPSQLPPRVTIVGMLIDRRVQPNRSKIRADQLQITSRRWPLEAIPSTVTSTNEPLNVDCILEGMQQWWWNYEQHSNDHPTKDIPAGTFVQAAVQALEHHAQRHPSRPVHLQS